MSTEDTTAEYAVQQIVTPIELHTRPYVSVGAKTDIGRIRENNEDKYEFFLAESNADLATKGHVFVVCDGMGGHEAGQIASELACKTFIDVYRNHPSDDPAAAARAAVAAANRFINDVARAMPSRKGMGTTMSALLVVQDKGYVVQVGDSRVYRSLGGECVQLTTDHTWVEETVRAGLMPREEAENHPYKHVITRALGTEQSVDPDVFLVELEQGDMYFLCSDGVTNHVSNERVGEILNGATPSEAAWRLVGEALVGGGSDNATALVVRIDRLEEVEGVDAVVEVEDSSETESE